MISPTSQPTNKKRNHSNQAFTALALLAFINLINQFDRRGLATIFPLLKLEWGLSDAQLGLAVSLFTISRTIITLPSGWLADKIGELHVIRPVVFLWSIFTALSGWAAGFTNFLLLRIGVGLSDGANGPIDLAYLGKVSPENKRGVFFSIYSFALYAGSAIGIIFAAAIGDRFGWRWVLLIPAVFGLTAGAGLFLLPKSENNRKRIKTENYTKDENYRFLSSFISGKLPFIFIGASLGVFASTGLVSWLPTYLTRQFEISLTHAGLLTGGLILPGSMAGTLAGGWLGDHFTKKNINSRYRLAAGGLVLAMTLGLAGLLVNSIFLTSVFFIISSFCFTIPVSPLLVIVQDSVPKSKLATTQAAFGLVTQLIGAAPAIALIGFFSDQFGLHFALIAPFIAAGLGGLVITLSQSKNNF